MVHSCCWELEEVEVGLRSGTIRGMIVDVVLVWVGLLMEEMTGEVVVDEMVGNDEVSICHYDRFLSDHIALAGYTKPVT